MSASDGWSEVSLGDICELRYGKGLPEASRSRGQVPVFGSNGIVGTHTAALTAGPAIVIGRKGSLGEVNFSPGACWPIDTTYFIDPGATREDLKWLSYRLKGLTLTRLNRAAAVPGLNREDAYRERFLLPPIREQRRIAAVLDRAEALRAKRREALARLGSLKEALFLDVFGDPSTNPRRWPGATLGDVLESQQYGPRFYNESYSEDGVRIVRITDLDKSGALDFESMPRLKVDSRDCEKYQLRPGDLVFARTGATVGKVALMRPGDPPCIAGAYFIRLRFDDRVEPAYGLAVLSAASIRAIVSRRSRQAAQQNFSGPALRQLPIPIPPIPLQRAFARGIAAIEKLKAVHRASLAKLDELFASLQHRAFRGEL